MQRKVLTRRDFVKASGATLALMTMTPRSFGVQARSRRLDWDTFKSTAAFPSFVRGIGAMRDNKDATDRRSWAYWVNSHLNYCPHGIAYFLAWHRGYVYYFEQYLRMVSGNPGLMLPYWDYYKNPRIPGEFTDAAPSNPLYVERINNDVTEALTAAPFAADVLNFPRGTINAFESSVERKPHDPVHDIIGGVMTTMQSPFDPIFWLHHANIDRLWVAWVAAGGGRRMPSPSSPYWLGAFTYGPGLAMGRYLTINCHAQMNYEYENEAFPAVIVTPTAQVLRAVPGARSGNAGGSTGLQRSHVISRPPVLTTLQPSGQRPTDSTRFSVGGVRAIQLDENPVSANIQIDPSTPLRLKEIIDADAALRRQHTGFAEPLTNGGAAIQIVFDEIRLTALGEGGGYFYHIYLNMPASAEATFLEANNLLGSIGSFAILSALHHSMQLHDHARGGMSAQSGAARLTFPATHLLAGVPFESLKDVTISLVRVSGEHAPTGVVITIGEMRMEISNDGVE
ncbi:MAG: tyrosinase family protein [Herminiimonas sp.]|nr:tyrosinase family protein [Herminiimonas sp.]